METGGPGAHDPVIADFQDEVDKEIVEEAPSDSFNRPGAGDTVTAVLSRRDNQDQADEAVVRTWVVGCGPELHVAGLDVDRCVRTMRKGEKAVMRLKSAGSQTRAALDIKLEVLEHPEDLLGDGKLISVTLQKGSGWQKPQVANELKVRFAWTVDTLSASLGAPSEQQPSTIVLAQPGEQADGTAPGLSRDVCDLQRSLLRRFGNAVQTRYESVQSESTSTGPRLVKVLHGDHVLAGGSECTSFSDAQAAIRSAGSQAYIGSTSGFASRGAREVAIRMEQGQCVCTAEDWIHGVAGFRVLADLREGERRLVRLSPELLDGKVKGLPDELPVGAVIEYDVELLRIMKLEDVSLDGSRGVLKKSLRDGEGYERPVEGAEVTLRVEARDDSSGAVLVEEREIGFHCASGKFCSAVEETVLTMKKGELCEVKCSDVAACVDEELGLTAILAHNAVVFSLELLDFEKIDLFGSEEAQRVAHCGGRKEVGSHFFAAKMWRRALRRYQHVLSTLAYLDHWKDAEAKNAGVTLRRQCNLNAAACWLKLDEWSEARKACDAVLTEDAGNVKALFRKGQALKELGNFVDAEQCLKQVCEFDSGNKEAVRMRAKVRELAKEEVEQQRRMFSRMAKGIAVDKGETATATSKEVKIVKESSSADAQNEAPDGNGAWLGAAAVLTVLVGSAVAMMIVRRRR